MNRHRGQVELISRGVCVRSNRLLLCQSVGAANTYLPGGHIEFGETAREALEREVREELGCRSRAGRFLGCIENRFVQKGETHCEVNLLFVLRVPGLASRRPPESREAKLRFVWAPMDELGKSAVLPGVLRRVLPRWLAAGGDSPGWATVV